MTVNTDVLKGTEYVRGVPADLIRALYGNWTDKSRGASDDVKTILAWLDSPANVEFTRRALPTFTQTVAAEATRAADETAS
ncbi:MAG: hypothetical protein JOY61_08720 [Chloroflexi bacterium]|nr:hypothetical protein [Chloroflexota bacterium]